VAGIGERIRRAREQCGLTQTALAQALPLSSSYLSLIESGKRLPGPDVVELIAEKLGCSADYLTTGRGGDENAGLELRLRFAELALQSGDPATARAGFDAVFQQIVGEDEAGLRDEAMWGRARAAERLGALDSALADLEWLAARTSLSDRVGRTAVLNGLCRTLYQLGDLTRAIEIGEQAARSCAEDPAVDPDRATELASTLVYCYLERGDYAMAHARAERLIEGAELVGSLRARAAAYWNAGLVAEARGDLETAQHHTQQALALYSASDLARHLASVRVDCAYVMLRSPEPDHVRAAELLREALDQLRDVAGPIDVAKAEAELARCHLMAGDASAASVVARTALERLGSSLPLEQASMMVVCAYAELASGERAAALRTCRRAADVLAACEPSRRSATVWCELARLMALAGEADAAVAAYDRAAAAVGIPHDPLSAVVATMSGIGR
jgi:transcriptional regulator with XRE-family HTH domain